MSFTATAFLLLDAAQATTPKAPQLTDMLVPFAFMAVIFYFLLIRPQQKQRKEQQALIAALKTGDKVVTSSGIYGLISNVKETTVTLKIADNVKIEIDKAAIATVVSRSGEVTVETPAS